MVSCQPEKACGACYFAVQHKRRANCPSFMSVIPVMSDRKLCSGDDTVFIFRKKTVDLRNEFVNLLSASSGIVLRLKMGFYLLL